LEFAERCSLLDTSFWRRTLFRCAAARRSAFVIFRIGITEFGSLTQPFPAVVGACVVTDTAGFERWVVFVWAKPGVNNPERTVANNSGLISPRYARVCIASPELLKTHFELQLMGTCHQRHLEWRSY